MDSFAKPRKRVKSFFDYCFFSCSLKGSIHQSKSGPRLHLSMEFFICTKKGIKKAPRTLRWWSFLKKLYVGIEGPSEIVKVISCCKRGARHSRLEMKL